MYNIRISHSAFMLFSYSFILFVFMPLFTDLSIQYSLSIYHLSISTISHSYHHPNSPRPQLWVTRDPPSLSYHKTQKMGNKKLILPRFAAKYLIFSTTHHSLRTVTNFAPHSCETWPRPFPNPPNLLRSFTPPFVHSYNYSIINIPYLHPTLSHPIYCNISFITTPIYLLSD